MTIQTPNTLEARNRLLARTITNAHQAFKNLAKQIEAAYVAQDHKRLNAACRHFTHNRLIKVSALHKAGFRSPTVDDYFDMAGDLCLTTAFETPVNWWPHAKKYGGYRPVCDLPIDLKAGHKIIEELIFRQMKHPDFIYNIRNKSRDELAHNLRSRLNSNFTHYRIYDVRNCFQNINPNALYELPINRRIIEHALKIENLILQRVAQRPAVIHAHDNYTYRDTTDTNENMGGPSGIMQGSPASNIILAFLFQAIPQPDNEEGEIFIFGDDLILTACDEDVCSRMENNFATFFGKWQIGPLTLVEQFSGNDTCFEFLGYEFAPNRSIGDWEIGISQRNRDKLEQKQRSAILRDREFGNVQAFEAYRASKEMLQGFSAMDNPERLLTQMAIYAEDYLHSSCPDFGVP